MSPSEALRLSESSLSESGLADSCPPESVQPYTAAEQLSATCYFNALLRECDSWHWRDLPPALAVPASYVAARLPLPQRGGALWLPVSFRSNGGRHQFVLPIWWESPEGRLQSLRFFDAVRWIAAEPTLLGAVSNELRELFVERVRASVANLARGLDARWRDLARLFSAPLTFAEAEQALLVGHSMHPTPKSRDQFTDVDAERFAPEFGNAFALHWLAVAPDCLHARSAAALSATELAHAVFDSEPIRCAKRPSLPDGMCLMPAHPWQIEHLKRHPRVRALFASGRVRDLGAYGGEWRATSSLRSVYSPQAPYMLKFSLSVRLTNSLRTLLPKEMRRGMQVHKVQQSPIGAAFAERCPQFTVLSEPAYLCLAGDDGEPIAESLVLFRDNPFVAEQQQNCCVLASLTQDHPCAGEPRVLALIRELAQQQQLSLAQAAQRWFGRFLDVVVEPLFIAQADFGLLFGAHQQNLVLRFDGSLPSHGYFRDCQGTGYSAVGYGLLTPYLPELGTETANIIDSEMANRLFSYYLIINSGFGLISAIAASGVIAESTLLQALRDRLQTLRASGCADSSCLDYALDSPLLWSKGNFRCSYQNINETTTADPLSVYHTMPNPLFRL